MVTEFRLKVPLVLPSGIWCQAESQHISRPLPDARAMLDGQSRMSACRQGLVALSAHEGCAQRLRVPTDNYRGPLFCFGMLSFHFIRFAPRRHPFFHRRVGAAPNGHNAQ